MPLLRKLLVPLLAGLWACATPKTAVDQVAPPEVVLDTMPAKCFVSVDGAERGETPLVFRAAHPQASHRIQFSREGYLPAEVTLTGQDVAKNSGSQVMVVLRPGSWDPKSRAIDPGDPVGIARAGQDLARANRCADALPYLERGLEMDPRMAPAHKSLGICYAKLNQQKKALEQYKAYLQYAPDAPDAEKVRAIVSKAQGDIDISETRPAE